MQMRKLVTGLAWAILASALPTDVSQSLPIVDLGYLSTTIKMDEARLADRIAAMAPSSNLQRLTYQSKTIVSSINDANQETGNYFNFTNIPYALPPTGDRRFRAPQAFEGKSSKFENGSIGHICPQSYPDWIAISGRFMRRRSRMRYLLDSRLKLKS